jgi:hypothetical protein
MSKSLHVDYQPGTLSCPGLTRASIFTSKRERKMNGRVKPGHDVGRGPRATERSDALSREEEC